MKEILKSILKQIHLYNFMKKIKENYNKEIFKRKAPNILLLLIDVLEENEIYYWIEYGTLLGAIREKKIIEHDYDIDIGVLESKIDKVKLEKVLKKSGFKKISEISLNGKVTENKYKYKKLKIGIDFYFFYEEKDKIKGYCYGSLPGLTYTETLKKLNGLIVYECIFKKFDIIKYEIYGRKIKIPQNYNEHLIEYYGKGYMIPDKRWLQENAKNIKKINNIGRIKRYE